MGRAPRHHKFAITIRTAEGNLFASNTKTTSHHLNTGRTVSFTTSEDPQETADGHNDEPHPLALDVRYLSQPLKDNKFAQATFLRGVVISLVGTKGVVRVEEDEIPMIVSRNKKNLLSSPSIPAA